MAKRVDIDEAAVSRLIEGASSEMLHQVGKEVAADARRLCPVDTGRLRDSIDYDVTGDTVRISASAPYARFVEEGTSTQKAQPFLRPALYKAHL